MPRSEAVDAALLASPSMGRPLDRLPGRIHLDVGQRYITRRTDDALELIERENVSLRNVLPRIYEYFICEFGCSEGHRGGEFFTPDPVARLLVEMLDAYEGRVLDPACGSCGCLCSPPASSRRTAAGPTRSPCSIRSATRRPGGSGA